MKTNVQRMHSEISTHETASSSRPSRLRSFLSSFILPPSSFSSDWPEFRGPTQDGHSDATGLPVEWSPEKNVVWKTPLPGKAWSSPIVAGGRIYLTNAVAAKDETDPHDARSLRVLALDAGERKDAVGHGGLCRR